MDLFDDTPDHLVNILPFDGCAHYFGPVFSMDEANEWFHRLSANIDWRQEQLVIAGEHRTMSRKMALYGDTADDGQALSYGYSQVKKRAKPWTSELLALKAIVEEKTGDRFNACLLNRYENGHQGMGWHSDNESDLVKNASIASLSFGAQRRFAFKHMRSQQRLSVHLEHGSLLVMKGDTQQHWLHQVPKQVGVHSPRINLTFRRVKV